MSDGSTAAIVAPWTKLASRIVLADRWIRLRADRCVTRRGATLDPFYVLEYAPWAHVAAFDAQDRIILVRQYRHGAGEASLELPGGAMDAGESDPCAAGARELLEETGYAAPALTALSTLSPNPASHANRLHLLLAEGAVLSDAQRLDPTEDIVVEPTPWREALRLALAGEMIHASHVGLLTIALARSGRLRV